MSLRPCPGADPADPADMSPDERLDEIASILARGVLRPHGRAGRISHRRRVWRILADMP